jgi:hypothetical protein
MHHWLKFWGISLHVTCDEWVRKTCRCEVMRRRTELVSDSLCCFSFCFSYYSQLYGLGNTSRDLIFWNGKNHLKDAVYCHKVLMSFKREQREALLTRVRAHSDCARRRETRVSTHLVALLRSNWTNYFGQRSSDWALTVQWVTVTGNFNMTWCHVVKSVFWRECSW